MSSSFSSQHRTGSITTAFPPSTYRPATSEGRNGASSSASSTFNKWHGAQSLWSNNTNFGSTHSATRQNSIPRGSLSFGAQNSNLSGKETIQAKTGSGQLVDSSVSDDYDFGQSFSKRDDGLRLNGGLPKSTEASFSQQRSNSNAGLPQAFAGAARNSSFSSSRPPTGSLNASTSTAPKPQFGATFDSPLSYMNEPPSVYTKYNKPPVSKQPDSAYGEWIDGTLTHSPVDDRRRPSAPTFFGLPSAPSSRNNSLPPSRHSDIQPTFPTKPDTFSSSQPPTNAFRVGSFSSASRPSGSFSAVDPQTNPLAQFSHMNLQDASQLLVSQRATFSGPSFGQTASAYTRNGTLDQHDDVEEIDRMPQPVYPTDGYAASNQATEYYRMSQYADRSTPNENTYAPRNGSAVSTFSAHAVQASSGFPTVPNPNTTAFLNQRLSVLQEQMDPRYLMNMQLPYPYGPFNGAFYPSRYPSGPAIHGLPAYPAMPSHMALDTMSLMGAPKGPRELETGHSLRSVLLEEFKNNNKLRRYELKDIFDHVVEFSGDQHGSRFIQQKLETANSDEKERLFREISPNAIQLMTDVFGNYVIQKFFEHGDQNQKKILANRMKGRVLELSLQMYGCRVVQKALEHILIDQQAMLVRELEKDVLRCVKDQNGNHVIQKAIERCDAKDIAFIYQAFTNQIHTLSIHTYGCRVIQRCLEKSEYAPTRAILLELRDCMHHLIPDGFGNYVAQHVVEYGPPEDRQSVIDLVSTSLEYFSKHKFASNVVEKCLKYSDEHWKREVIELIAKKDSQRDESMLLGLIRDNYGNYVIQKLLDLCNQHDFEYFVDMLHPELAKAKRTGCGKQVASIEKRMQRPLDTSLQIRPTVYASRTVSQNTTPPPPPLTADNRSLQTSSVGSVNGDTLEGATSSRKGSVQHIDPRIYEG